jgi:hypothetical protein
MKRSRRIAFYIVNADAVPARFPRKQREPRETLQIVPRAALLSCAESAALRGSLSPELWRQAGRAGYS